MGRKMNQLDSSSFEQKIKVSLDDSANTLDSITRSELINRREQALKARRSWFDKRLIAEYLIPVSSLAFCLIIGVFYVYNPVFLSDKYAEHTFKIDAQKSDEQVAMLEVLSNAESVEVELEVMSDPYFLVWLSDEAQLNTLQQLKETENGKENSKENSKENTRDNTLENSSESIFKKTKEKVIENEV